MMPYLLPTQEDMPMPELSTHTTSDGQRYLSGSIDVALDEDDAGWLWITCRQAGQRRYAIHINDAAALTLVEELRGARQQIWTQRHATDDEQETS